MFRSIQPFKNSLKACRKYTTGGYDSTVKNIMVNKNTKVICQGFTGKQVRKWKNAMVQTLYL
jgi:succinyl-CoA synthetase alpha subunit